MNKHKHPLPLLSVFFFLIVSLLPLQTNAITVIRANIKINAETNLVDIGIFENQTPLTVNNFKSYINDGDYINTLIYSSFPGSVIQTGAYTFNKNSPPDPEGAFLYDKTLDQYNGGLQPVGSKGTVINEFKLPNSRGSIAMAIISGAPDSANNEWFINLADNVETFDLQNGGDDPGLTVFGKVLGDGMDVFEQIAGLETFNFSNYHPAFASFPTANYTPSDQSPGDLVNNNLVIISSFSEIYQVTTFVHFGDPLPLPGDTVQKDILISNAHDTPLVIDTTNISTIAAPFSVVSNPCPNTLTNGEQCTIQVAFTMPTSPGYFNDQFDIEVTSETKVFTVELTTSSPDIDVSKDIIEFGLVPVYTSDQAFPEKVFPLLINRGDKQLLISSIALGGVNKNEFELIDNCTTEFNPFEPGKVLPGGFCAIGIAFKPTSLDEKFASLIITSDDPDSGELIIPIHGGATSDSDGIPPNIENGSPNAGDGNNDDIPDRLQSNVASFLNKDNSYTTLVTHDNAIFFNVSSIQLSTLEALADNIVLSKGAFRFELVDIPVGTTAEVGLILAAGNSPSDIYSFSPTDENNNPHWYALAKNASPGALIYGNALLTSPSKTTIQRNITSIKIRDGGNGDADMIANGQIVFVGGPAITDSTDEAGTVLWLIFIIPLLASLIRRNYVVKLLS